MTNGNISSHSEIFGVKDFVSGWVVEDGFGVDSGLVGECAPSGDVVVAEGKEERRNERESMSDFIFLSTWSKKK